MLQIRRVTAELFSGTEKIEEEVPPDVLDMIVNQGFNVVVLGNNVDLERRWEVLQR